jgi:MYXO-CTERM domain-containing protein
MRGRLRSLIFAGALTVVILTGRGAGAYVQAVSDSGNLPLSWSSSCETVTIYLNGFTAMTPDEVAKSIGGAAAAWGPDAVTCPATIGDGGAGHPYFEILPQLSTSGAAPGVAPDRKNVIVFETATWDPSLSPEALAFTSVWKEPSGNIIDADIEINATNPEFEWANLDPGAPPGKNGIPRYDLQTVMTHEFGHFLGLAHTCTANPSTGDDGNSAPTSGKDDRGQPIPTCDDTGVPQYAAVMWATVDSDSIIKRVLSTDDARGVCAIYPPAQDPRSCTQNLPDDGCGCAVGTLPGRLAGLALVSLALVFAVRRRRPRRRR